MITDSLHMWSAVMSKATLHITRMEVPCEHLSDCKGLERNDKCLSGISPNLNQAGLVVINGTRILTPRKDQQCQIKKTLHASFFSIMGQVQENVHCCND